MREGWRMGMGVSGCTRLLIVAAKIPVDEVWTTWVLRRECLLKLAIRCNKSWRTTCSMNYFLKFQGTRRFGMVWNTGLSLYLIHGVHKINTTVKGPRLKCNCFRWCCTRKSLRLQVYIHLILHTCPTDVLSGFHYKVWYCGSPIPFGRGFGIVVRSQTLQVPFRRLQCYVFPEAN